jgi:hypothetical protein
MRRQLRKEGKELDIEPPEPEEAESVNVVHDDQSGKAGESADPDGSVQAKVQSPRSSTDSKTLSEFVAHEGPSRNIVEDIENQDNTDPSTPGAGESVGSVEPSPDNMSDDADEQPALLKKKVGKARLKREKKAAAQQQTDESVSIL